MQARDKRGKTPAQRVINVRRASIACERCNFHLKRNTIGVNVGKRARSDKRSKRNDGANCLFALHVFVPTSIQCVAFTIKGKTRLNAD